MVNGGQAQGFAAGGGSAGGGGGGAGGGGSSSAYYYSQQQTSSGHQRSDSYDSATLRATGTFSNKGIDNFQHCRNRGSGLKGLTGIYFHNF